MSAKEITAKVNSSDREAVTVTYDFGDNLDEAVSLFGAEVVFARFAAAATVDLQGVIRRHMVDQLGKDGQVTSAAKSDEEIAELVANWKPGLAKPKKSAKEKLTDMLAALDPEARAALLAEYAEE
jgi:hypothetical protein